jgi:hypothetical protein
MLMKFFFKTNILQMVIIVDRCYLKIPIVVTEFTGFRLLTCDTLRVNASERWICWIGGRNPDEMNSDLLQLPNEI